MKYKFSLMKMLTVELCRDSSSQFWGFSVNLDQRIIDHILNEGLAQRAGLRLGDLVEELQYEHRPDPHRIEELVNNCNYNVLQVVVLRDFVNGESFITTTSNSGVQQTRDSSFSDWNSDHLHQNQKAIQIKFPSRLKTDSNNNNQRKENWGGGEVPTKAVGSNSSIVLQEEDIDSNPLPSYMQSQTLRLIREGEMQKRWSNNCKENFNNNVGLNHMNEDKHLPECFLCGRNIV